MFHWGRGLGRADHVTALERLIAERVAASPEIAGRFGAVIDGRLSPYQLFPPSRVVPWIAAAALRGRLRPMASLGTVVAEVLRSGLELRRRKRRLAGMEREVRGTDAALPGPARQGLAASDIVAERVFGSTAPSDLVGRFVQGGSVDLQRAPR